MIERRRPPRLDLGPALMGGALMFAVLAYAYWIEDRHPEFFYRSVQEDAYIEWGTFWAFMLAGVAFAWGALQQRWKTRRLPWFLTGLGLFCVVVAMEEVSWGQRVVGYRPPAYFLEHNFQQELNVHNVVDSDLRQDAFVGLILAYGVALAVLGAVPRLSRWLTKLAFVPPPVALAPAFGAAVWLYVDYPWRFTGEIVELVVGIGFLSAAVIALREHWPTSLLASPGGGVCAVLGAGLLTLALGVANATASRAQRSASPGEILSTRLELEALKRDFDDRAEKRGGQIPVTCGIHKRLYTYILHYRKDFLKDGEYVALTSQGLPEERAEFFIDPWNDPYWIRSRCTRDEKRRSVFLYSFGPNRLRDSGKWEYRDDDIGIYLLRIGFGDGTDTGEAAASGNAQ